MSHTSQKTTVQCLNGCLIGQIIEDKYKICGPIVHRSKENTIYECRNIETEEPALLKLQKQYN